jgi:hypothetical protein
MIGFAFWLWPPGSPNTGAPPPPTFQQSLDFSDLRNSGYAAILTGI